MHGLPVSHLKWFMTVFLPFIRMFLSELFTLIMDYCGPHGTDVLDQRKEVEILTLPPNCTAKFQPMDMGVITAFWLWYGRLFWLEYQKL